MNVSKQIEAILNGKRMSRQRVIRALELLLRGREVAIQSHPEPDTLRAVYPSDMAGKLLEGRDVTSFDPIGRIRWLREVDAFVEELEGGEA
jgi:hypothetical protein